jgi:hypothetical protein
LAAKVQQHGAEEFGRDFEMLVRLELGVASRPNLMQHENGAGPRENRPQQIMGAGEVKRFQTGTDHVVAKLLHLGWFGLGMRSRS